MCVTDSVGSHNAQPWQCAPMPWFHNKLWFSVRNIQKVCECRGVHLINSLWVFFCLRWVGTVLLGRRRKPPSQIMTFAYICKSRGTDQISPSLSRAGLGARGVCFEIHYARYIELLICMWPTQCNCKPPFELTYVVKLQMQRSQSGDSHIGGPLDFPWRADRIFPFVSKPICWLGRNMTTSRGWLFHPMSIKMHLAGLWMEHYKGCVSTWHLLSELI